MVWHYVIHIILFAVIGGGSFYFLGWLWVDILFGGPKNDLTQLIYIIYQFGIPFFLIWAAEKRWGAKIEKHFPSDRDVPM